MKRGKLIMVMASTLSLIFTVGSAKATVTPVVEDMESTAKNFVLLLSKGEFDEADKMLAEIVRTPPQTVKPLVGQEEVAKIMARYDLIEIPVTDENDIIVGEIHMKHIINKFSEITKRKR